MKKHNKAFSPKSIFKMEFSLVKIDVNASCFADIETDKLKDDL